MFVFAGTIIEGRAGPGMKFEVPEGERRWTFIIRSVELIRKVGGTATAGLVVENGKPGYLPGMGAGWTAELQEGHGGLT
jgi:hypothetical protein